MSQETQEFSVKEVLQFIHDSLRFMRASGTLPRDWTTKDSADLNLYIPGFRNQPVVRLVDNVVKHAKCEATDTGIYNLSQLSDVVKLLQQSLHSKLELMADQGIFDPIVPWIGSIVAENKNTVAKLWTEIKPVQNKETIQIVEAEADTALVEEDDSNNKSLGSNEVVIHVVDDVRGGQKDFSLPANILLEKMPYFAKATRGQLLSDVDITVHCDVHIFEWLTRWMNSPNNPPLLEPSNVVPVLLSAAFLETETLVEECLNFCHNQTNQILDAKQSFSCLNDQLIEKLAAKFTAAEVEQLGHQRSSLQARLYAFFIVDLCSTKTNPKRGIFKTAATLFQCVHCGNLLTEEVQSKVPCTSGRVILTKTGQLVYRHQRDTSWNLTEYIQNLKITLKTWRRVYWRLWSQTHFLECSSCSMPFAATDFMKCLFHPESSHYMGTTRNKGNFQPIGKYSCCQQQVLRFATVPNHHGCRMKEHTVSCLNLEQIQVTTVCRQFSEFIHVAGPPKVIQATVDPSKAPRLLGNDEEVVPRFTLGLQSRPRRHLVPLPWQLDQYTNKDINRPKTASSSQDSVSTTGSAESDEKFRKVVNVLDPHSLCYEDDEDMQEDEVEDPSGTSMNKPAKALGRDGLKRISYPQMLGMRRKFSSRREFKIKPIPPVKEIDLRWNPCLSTRTNQDSQRYLEEEMFRRIVNQLAPPQWQKARSPVGGLFAKIHRILQEKALREARRAKMLPSATSISTAMTAALAARKFKAHLHSTANPI
ncbi:SANT and BTB domain regulator of class switch recombination-like isoform X1 [Daphnia pulicaria]|uniref:SANT and BTB domain regulator of class switch recombination-like isoform X1 n=1 Tax=Daphnia pulicaria TaxID=35523 RepID=UPI001EECBB9A|nr:SANT and BTB domain regulator of class switch recombination-like isoform X1 [Daphnia pulicaria]